MIKLCWFCKHCEYSEAYSYSSWTYGSEDFTCWKGHFTDDPSVDDTVALLELANSCPDYELKDEVQAYIEGKQ